MSPMLPESISDLTACPYVLQLPANSNLDTGHHAKQPVKSMLDELGIPI